MILTDSKKIKAEHLKRDAFLYIRQSTIKQVLENTESKKRQYELKNRAISLGWPEERIHTIDSDLGQSGASTVDREGFKKLTAEVSLEHAGIVIGLEVSRLARNCADWHRLLEICALTNTLILDEDGLYNPDNFNDRLLLGLKGTMSEAELHTMRARLRGGIISKAKRAELRIFLPTGYVYDGDGNIKLDPDKQIQNTIRFFFETFRRVRSALGVVKVFKEKELKFPTRIQRGKRKEKVYWRKLTHSRASSVLHNPDYTGAYCYGRTTSRRGTKEKKLPKEEWTAFFPETFEGYISWKEYEDNEKQLKENTGYFGLGPVKNGPALLQGIVICGYCGRKMRSSYHKRKGENIPQYLCTFEVANYAGETCQSMSGDKIDDAIGKLVTELITPEVLKASIDVHKELISRREEATALLSQAVDRAQYEMNLAKQRYMNVDPNNRLVADELEAEWNGKITSYNKAKEDYERRKKEDIASLNSDEVKRIKALATDFPKLWNNPKTSQKERKRMVNLLIEDVTLTKRETISVQVRLKGGAVRELEVPVAEKIADQRRTSPKVVEEIDRLLEKHDDLEITDILKRKELHTGTGKQFTLPAVRRVRMAYGLKTRLQRMKETGLLTTHELAVKLGVYHSTVQRLRRRGKLKGYRCNDRGDFLFEPPSDKIIRKIIEEIKKNRKKYHKKNQNRSKISEEV